jgi:hypothetical protein
MFMAWALCRTSAWADAVCSRRVLKHLEQWPAALTIRFILRDPRSWELNPLQSLHQLYSLFVPNKLHFTWRGELLQVCAACPTPRLNLSSSSVPLGTISKIRSPPGPCRIQQNYLVSNARLRREERAPTRRRWRECGTAWEAISVRERADTALPGFESEPTPPVQHSRVCRHRLSRVRGWTNTAGPAFKSERTPPFQGSRESRPRVWGVRQ